MNRVDKFSNIPEMKAVWLRNICGYLIIIILIVFAGFLVVWNLNNQIMLNVFVGFITLVSGVVAVFFSPLRKFQLYNLFVLFIVTTILIVFFSLGKEPLNDAFYSFIVVDKSNNLPAKFVKNFDKYFDYGLWGSKYTSIDDAEMHKFNTELIQFNIIDNLSTFHVNYIISQNPNWEVGSRDRMFSIPTTTITSSTFKEIISSNRFSSFFVSKWVIDSIQFPANITISLENSGDESIIVLENEKYFTARIIIQPPDMDPSSYLPKGLEFLPSVKGEYLTYSYKVQMDASFNYWRSASKTSEGYKLWLEDFFGRIKELLSDEIAFASKKYH